MEYKKKELTRNIWWSIKEKSMVEFCGLPIQQFNPEVSVPEKVRTMFHSCFSFFQKGTRRFEKAMQGIPDRVPVCAQMHEFAMQEIGAATMEFYTTSVMLAAATLEIQEKYGIDVPVLNYDVYNIEAETIG